MLTRQRQRVHEAAAKMNPTRRTELDGLRAVAVISVLAFHCLRFPIATHPLLAYAGRIPVCGWGGVDVFFVLSGFLIGGILIDGRGQPDQLRSFMIRRCVRIVPLYAVVVASFYALSATIYAPWLFEGAAPWWTYATLTQNFATPILRHDALYLGPTWSLAVEVQIYVALGIALTRAPMRSLWTMMVAGIALAECGRIALAVTGHGTFTYFVTPARIDGACFGVLAAMLVRSERGRDMVRKHQRHIWLAVATLAVGVVLLAIADQGAGTIGAAAYTHLALALGSAGTIAALVVTDGTVNRFLRQRAFVRLGAISYGVYLLHVPAIGLARAMLDRPGLRLDDGVAALSDTMGIALAVALAWLSYRYFETPLNDWAHRISRAPARHKVQMA